MTGGCWAPSLHSPVILHAAASPLVGSPWLCPPTSHAQMGLWSPQSPAHRCPCAFPFTFIRFPVGSQNRNFLLPAPQGHCRHGVSAAMEWGSQTSLANRYMRSEARKATQWAVVTPEVQGASASGLGEAAPVPEQSPDSPKTSNHRDYSHERGDDHPAGGAMYPPGPSEVLRTCLASTRIW